MGDFADLCVDVLDLERNQATHLIQGLSVGVEHLVQHKGVWQQLRELVMRQDMVQLVLFDQVPGIQIFHRSSFGAASLNALHRFG